MTSLRSIQPSVFGGFVLGCLVLGVSLACEGGGATAPTPPSASSEPAAAAAPAPEHFGAAFTAAPEVPLADLLQSPKQFASKDIITKGEVKRACSRKGCWMEIASADSACRVTFQDYGFFVPKDSAGARVRLQGRVDTRVVSASRVRHLEREGATFPSKNADGTANEVRLIASAVDLTR